MIGEPSRGAVRIVGRYALHDEIAAGGMATVHLGRLLGASGFSRTVAIKRLHVHLAKDPEFVSMLLDEARIVGRIRHLNVVPTLDVVSSDGEVFLVMEYVQGETLARLSRASSRAGRPLPVPIAVAIVTGVLHGLHAAHEARTESGEPLDIVHRDVSPQNVLVGVDGIARVLDFGVAKASGRIQTTREGQLKGKLGYMAAEQIHGAPSPKSDVYAASVVLWETLTGRRLFDGETEAAILARVLTGEIVPPSTHATDVSPELDAIVLRGLERDPSKRFPTAREMARALASVGPVATVAEVAEVVESLAAEKLAERAGRVAEVESSSAVDVRALAPVVSDVSGEIETGGGATGSFHPRAEAGSPAGAPLEAPRRRRRRMAFALGAIMVLAVTSIWLFTTRRERPLLAEPRSLASAPASPSASPSVSVGADVASAAPEPSVSAAPGKRPPPGPRGRCSPPYTIDSSGFKRYKRECLK